MRAKIAILFKSGLQKAVRIHPQNIGSAAFAVDPALGESKDTADVVGDNRIHGWDIVEWPRGNTTPALCQQAEAPLILSSQTEQNWHTTLFSRRIMESQLPRPSPCKSGRRLV